MKWIAGFILVIMIPTVPSSAGEADVVQVSVTASHVRTYRFEVTVQHGDTSWDHYADKWEIVAPDGNILGTRKLLHPHVNEQPFTRSLSYVKVPNNIRKVSVRAHDSVHAFGGKVMILKLP
jgi:hypothetical protein